MKAIITGMNGTLGRVLQRRLADQGWETIGWNRREVPINDYHAMEKFIQSVGPSALFNLAIASRPEGLSDEDYLVHVHWPGEMAWICRLNNVPMIHTSTVMVFTDRQPGPYQPWRQPCANEGYGASKKRSEEKLVAQWADGVRIARLGWQIGDGPGGNNMVEWLVAKNRDEGVIRPSDRWLPACSHLEDTANALISLVNKPGGFYHIDSNRGWNFHEIVTAMEARLNLGWKIEADSAFVYNQMMIDDRLSVPSLRERFPALRSL